MSLAKLHDALPQLVGRTIERTLVSEHRDGRFQVFLFFTDGTAYEFYGRDSINGARRVVLMAPDRRAKER